MNEHTIAVGEADFLEKVIARSGELPVLVDFWAAWCAPCRALGPVLEQLALEGNGRFLLAKVDTDQAPTLAQRFQIRGIPAVKLFRNGQPVAEFTGALPAAEVRSFLDQHIPDEATLAVRRAIDLIGKQDFVHADETLRPFASGTSDAPLALVTKARVALLRGRVSEALELAKRVPTTADERELADAIELAATLAVEAQALTTLPAGPEGTLLSAGQKLAAAEITAALDALLDVVRVDRKLRDDAARKTIIALFSVLGVRSETSDDYRRKLGALL